METAKSNGKVILNFRARPLTAEIFHDAAASEGMSLSSWLRDLGARRVEALRRTRAGEPDMASHETTA